MEWQKGSKWLTTCIVHIFSFTYFHLQEWVMLQRKSLRRLQRNGRDDKEMGNKYIGDLSKLLGFIAPVCYLNNMCFGLWNLDFGKVLEQRVEETYLQIWGGARDQGPAAEHGGIEKITLPRGPMSAGANQHTTDAVDSFAAYYCTPACIPTRRARVRQIL